MYIYYYYYYYYFYYYFLLLFFYFFCVYRPHSTFSTTNKKKSKLLSPNQKFCQPTQINQFVISVLVIVTRAVGTESPRHCQTKEMALCAIHGPSLETLKPDGLGVNQTADVGLGWTRSPLNRCMSSAHTLRSCLRTCGSWASRLWNCIRIIITVLTPRSLPLRRLSSSALRVNKHYFVQNDPKAIQMSYFFRHAQSAVNHESSQMV